MVTSVCSYSFLMTLQDATWRKIRIPLLSLYIITSWQKIAVLCCGFLALYSIGVGHNRILSFTSAQKINNYINLGWGVYLQP
jgi:hypothetical protein